MTRPAGKGSSSPVGALGSSAHWTRKSASALSSLRFGDTPSLASAPAFAFGSASRDDVEILYTPGPGGDAVARGRLSPVRSARKHVPQCAQDVLPAGTKVRGQRQYSARVAQLFLRCRRGASVPSCALLC